MADWRVPKCNPDIGLTENSSHGVSRVKGTLDSHNGNSGMSPEVIVVPNVGQTTYHKKEIPSQNA